MFSGTKRQASLVIAFVIAFGGVVQGLLYLYRAASSPILADLVKKAGFAWIMVLLLGAIPLWFFHARRSRAKAGVLVGGLFGVVAASLTLGIAFRASSAESWIDLAASGVAFTAWLATYLRVLSALGSFGSETQLSVSALSGYRSYFPGHNQIHTVLDLRSAALTDIDVVSPSTLRSWFETNPFCIRTVDNRDGCPVGYWNVLLLKRDAFYAFRNGELEEEDVGRFAVDWAEAKGKAVYLYIAAVACATRRAGDSAAVVMDMAAFFLNISEHSHVRGIAAWAASDQGATLLDRFTFHCGSHKLHGRPIYFVSRKVDIERLAELCRSMRTKMHQFVPTVDEASVRAFGRVTLGN
jgi:hypothetical protein